MVYALLAGFLLHHAELPMGSAPEPVALPHFPDRLHAYVWRNWTLVPVERLAQVVGPQPQAILDIGRAMGLPDPPEISAEQQQRTHITVLRRNWHLLPYDQLIELLGWTPEKMAYALREGDGLFWWFGQYKPKVDRLEYGALSGNGDSPVSLEDSLAGDSPHSPKARAGEIASIIQQAFPDGIDSCQDPLFSFVARLNAPCADSENGDSPVALEDSLAWDSPHFPRDSVFSPRFCFSYYAPFRNPLSGEQDPYPEGYLARLAASGVDGVWLHEPLYKLAPFPWDPSLSARHEECIENLRALVARARKHGIGVYLYLNEPRPMPLDFFEDHPELRGVDDDLVIPGQVAALCTSVPAVQDYLRSSVASLCRAVPDLAGLFTITASESCTNCWAHGRGERCPRCKERGPEVVIAEINTRVWEGIAESGSKCKLIVWDWGWRDEWAEGIIRRLPEHVWLMSPSEWSLPIERGGIRHAVGEYSLSAVGPGPRATRHWKLARDRGLHTIAKIQASSTWELAAVPYIPVVENAARHAANLRETDVDGRPRADGLMMSWTLGGYPSPNFEAVIEMGRPNGPTIEQALLTVAARRFGSALAPAVVEAWRAFSAAFTEFPFHNDVLYRSPIHMGPANLLWGEPTGYQGAGAMAFGCPFDDLDSWRGVYPPDVFISQFEKVADGFDEAIATIERATAHVDAEPAHQAALAEALGVAEACAIHFRSVANQAAFVRARQVLGDAPGPDEARPILDKLEGLLDSEIQLATRLHAIQTRDSRIGFEAACQYFYVPIDLAEKVINCHDLLKRWLPAQRARHGS